MGPWQNGYFPNLPTDQHFIFALPRHPKAQSGSRFNHLGEIGLFVDGIRMFDACDAFSYSHGNGLDADPRGGIGQGDRIWNRDALMNEARTFDAAYAHQQNRGTYHYHVEPIALRYLLGDHVDLDPATQTYLESSAAPVKHSPILGWMQFTRHLLGWSLNEFPATLRGLFMNLEAKTSAVPAPSDFIRDIVAAHVAENKYPRIRTRFPPEPNGYLHIGHAKSICLNFGIAHEFGGICNLRMDDTNPAKEDIEYVESIQADVNWLIGGWAEKELGLKAKGQAPEVIAGEGKRDFYQPAATESEIGNRKSEMFEPFYASDYFDQIYDYAEELIEKWKAFVCDLTPDQTDEYRRSGMESPFRNRSIEENLDLFQRMKAGEFADGTRTLRAKIDASAPNIWLRDPLLYRIKHTEHHQTGKKWCIYPMYDFAHCLSDYIEGITHSICTLEFEVHRPLYDWILENLDLPRALPRQYEFARLALGYTVMSKRKLMQLVDENLVTGWDDPRLPTISGLRRRGVTPVALRAFAYNIGITKYNGITDVSVLEFAIREDLNKRSLRRLAVLRPVKVVITNYPEGQVEELDATNNPEDEAAGKRKVPFSRELFIERDDFAEVPPPKFFRLKPGGEVRLKYAYIIKCEEVVKDAAGNVTELRCTADLESKTGGATSARKVKGTIHWVSAAHAVDAEVRLYDRLFTVPEPDADGDFKAHLNPHSLEVITAKCEPGLKSAKPEERYQFERLAYFALDLDSTSQKLVFNRTITLKDTWAKEAKKN